MEATEFLAAIPRRRGLSLLLALAIPDVPIWAATYRKLAIESAGLREQDSLSTAVEVARAFIDPVLGDAASGVWSPERLAWRM